MKVKKHLALLLAATILFAQTTPIFAEDSNYIAPTDNGYGDKEIMANIATDGWMAFMMNYVTKSTKSVTSAGTTFNRSEISDYSNFESGSAASVKVFTDNTPLDMLLFNVNYCRDLTNSEVIDSAAYSLTYEVDETTGEVSIKKDENGNVIKTDTIYDASSSWFDQARSLQLAGIDWLEYAIDDAHDEGVEAWASIRMNDTHYLTDNKIAHSFIYQYPEYLLSGSQRMNYGKAPVRNYWKNYIVELATKYDIDGFELDFLRDTRYFENANEGLTIMTDWLKEIRAAVDEIEEQKALDNNTEKKDIKIYARVFRTITESKNIGLDPAQWIADGSVDGIIASCYDVFSYDYPIDEWRTEISSKNTNNNPYKLIIGGSNYVGCANRDYSASNRPSVYNQDCMYANPETMKGVASSAYSHGADGAYTFNLWHFSDCRHADVSTDGVTTMHSGTQEWFTKKFQALDGTTCEDGYREHVHDISLTSYPKTINGNSSYSFSQNTATAPTNGHYTVRIGIDSTDNYLDDPLTVTVNGTQATQIRDVPRDTSFVFSRDNERYRPFHISQTSPRVMQFNVSDLSLVNNGVNDFVITNNDDESVCILWIDIAINSTEGSTPAQSDYYFYAAKNLTAERNASGAAVLNWENQGVSNATGINVLRKTLSASDYDVITTIDITDTEYPTTYTDTTASITGSYMYKLQYTYSDENILSVDSNSAICLLSNTDYAILGIDMSTGTHWEGKYGLDGYTIFGYADGWASNSNYGTNPKLHSYPFPYTNVTGEAETSLIKAPEYLTSYTISGISGRPINYVDQSYALDKPEWLDEASSKTTILNSDPLIRLTEGATASQYKIAFKFSDNKEHAITGYFVEAQTSNLQSLPIYLLDNEDNIVSTISITPGEFKNGGYIRFKAKNGCSIMFESQNGVTQGARFGFAGFFFDDAPNAENDFADVNLTSFNVNGYNTCIDNEYAYTLVDNKTVVKTSLRTGEEVARYTETNSKIEFAQTWAGYSSNPYTQNRYITVSNGIVCVALAKCDDGSGNAMGAPIACRLIDFNTTTPTSYIFRYKNDACPNSIQAYGSYLYVTDYEVINIYDIQKIIDNQTSVYATGIAKNSSSNPAYVDSRNTHHIYGKDETGTVSASRVSGGRVASLNITWDESGTGKVLYTPVNNNYAMSVGVTTISETSGNYIPYGKGISNITLNEIAASANITTVRPTDARLLGNYIIILNKPATGTTDNCVLIYDYINSYIPSFSGKIVPDTNVTFTAIETYNNYVLIGTSDNKLLVYDPVMQSLVKTYSLSASPVRMDSSDGYVYCQLSDKTAVILSKQDISFVNNVVKAKQTTTGQSVLLYGHILNNTYLNEPLKAYMAHYNSTGSLIGVTIKDITAQITDRNSTAQKVSLSFDATGIDLSNVKIFLWGENMKPLMVSETP